MLGLNSKQRDDHTVSASKARQVQGAALDGNALFDAMVCEVHWLALQVGGVAQLFNASTRKKRTWMLRIARNVLPVEAAAIKVALQSWRDIALPHSQSQTIARLILNVAEAKQKTESVVDRLSSISTDVPEAVIEQLAAVWRKLADDLQRIVQDLEPETRFRLDSGYSENALCLGRLLKDAVSGGEAQIDAMGNVTLPILPQRRREPRYTLLQPCKVTARRQTWMAFARDVSRNGLGITSTASMSLREPVVVELANGRKFAGRVVWSKDGNHGINFNDPIAATDPLISP